MACGHGARPRLTSSAAWLGQQDQAVIGLRVDRELRRGAESIRVVIVASVEAGDVAEALGLAWRGVLEAAGDDLDGWDLDRAEAEVRSATA